MHISDWESEGWDLLKFQQVKKNTLYVYSVHKAVAYRMTATINPHLVSEQGLTM